MRLRARGLLALPLALTACTATGTNHSSISTAAFARLHGGNLDHEACRALGPADRLGQHLIPSLRVPLVSQGAADNGCAYSRSRGPGTLTVEIYPATANSDVGHETLVDGTEPATAALPAKVTVHGRHGWVVIRYGPVDPRYRMPVRATDLAAARRWAQSIDGSIRS